MQAAAKWIEERAALVAASKKELEEAKRMHHSALQNLRLKVRYHHGNAAENHR